MPQNLLLRSMWRIYDSDGYFRNYSNTIGKSRGSLETPRTFCGRPIRNGNSKQWVHTTANPRDRRDRKPKTSYNREGFPETVKPQEVLDGYVEVCQTR